MNIIIAPDSFKESLTALEVANAIESGFKKVICNAHYIKIPMADGGEGTVQSLVDATQGEFIPVIVTAPLGNKVSSFFGLSGDKKTAFIEMAAASGLHLVKKEKRNPLYTSSFGTGELINAALQYPIEKIILGIGGSATNDGGCGMIQALGAKLLDSNHHPISLGGKGLLSLQHIDLMELNPRFKQITIDVACDVNNPLCGKNGASAIFGPQKGATSEQVVLLDQALSHFADIVNQQLNIDIAYIPGAGAAGGMGAGLLAFSQAVLKPGINIIIEAVELEEIIAHADLVITGEGRIDGQTIHGKTPIGVAKLAKKYHKPVIAIAGCLREDYDVVYQHGIDAVFPILRKIAPLNEVLSDAEQNIISTAQNIARLYQLAR